MSLTFAYGQGGKRTGAKFTDRGCLSCPPGYAFTADDALSVLERATNNILLEGWKDYRKPMFALADLPIKPARYEQFGALNQQIRYHAFYEQLQHQRFYDPTPSVQTFQATQKLIEQCQGNLAMAQFIGNANSLGCAPPRGNRGVSGKDRYFSSAVTTVLEIGPFCVTDYLNQWDFAGQLEAMKKAAIEGSGMALEYEKMRKFVEMSYNNASAVAGTTRPTFFRNKIGEFPTSPGSFDWIFHAVDSGLGVELSDRNYQVVVKCSQRLLQYWIARFKADHNIQVWATAENVRNDTVGYITSFQNGGDFTLTSLRTNRKIRFSVDVEPTYLLMSKTGIGQGEWDFQNYYETEVGDGETSDQANGFRQRLNPYYGDPCFQCDGPKQTLVEPVFVFTDKAFHYEAFPNNPLGTQINAGVNTNLNALWGSTDIMWRFGVAVQEYDLNPLIQTYKDAGVTGFPCWNNRDNTWFAGTIKTGCQFVEDDPRQMMTLFFTVPSEDVPLGKSDCLLPSVPPAPYDIFPRDNSVDEPLLCNALPYGYNAPVDTAPGCIMTPAQLQSFMAITDKVVTVKVRRVDGTSGSLTVNYAYQNGTAIQGTDFLFTNGSLVFADGEDYKEFTYTLKSIVRTAGQHFFKEFKINWTASAGVICAESILSTPVCVALVNLAGDSGDCPDPSCDNCPPYTT